MQHRAAGHSLAPTFNLHSTSPPRTAHHRCRYYRLQPGDLAIVDFSAKRADTGEELVGAQRQSMRLDTDDADTTFLPGVVAIMAGMRQGEERQAPLTFPTDGAWAVGAGTRGA